MKTISLLDMLSLQMGCTYLSDLRFLNAFQYRKLAEILAVLPAEDFDLREWKDALRYLTGENRQAMNVKQVRSELIAWLQTR